MAITVKHSKVSTIPDDADTSLVRPSDWNDDHVLTGTVPVANGGTGASTLTGYVKGNGTSAMTASATVPSTDVTGLGTMSTQNSNNISVTGGSMNGVTISDYVATATKGVANGVASLDGSGTVPVSQLPAAVLGALSYQGTWNASTNTPTLTSSVGTKGYYYVVSVAGSTNLNGITDWVVGDWAVYNGTAWQKVDNTDAVTSVNGYTGTVVLTTTDVAEGTNQYFTTARARTSVSAGTGISYDNVTGVITNSSPSLGGDVVGPTSATDNAVVRFDTTTGKLIQNSVVTIGDTGAATGFTTLSASTSVTTPIVQASNSGGLSLKNSAGTTQISMGAGGGDNASINVSTNINGTNAQIDISPTGTGHVHINPTGVNSIQINPTYVGTMDNMTIGATTPKAITGTTITATTFSGSGASLTSIPNSALVNSAITINGTSTSLGGSISVGTVTSVTGTAPVVSSGGNTPAISMPAATGSVNGYLTSTDWTTFNNKGSGTVTAVSVTSANGFAGTSSGGATPALTLSTSVSGVLKGNGTAISAATSGTDYSAGTSALSTGILKSTTTTGALSIAVAADFPTLNQNTTGSAATLTTPRAIYGNNFDGSAALTQIIASTYGGTGNGFTKFSGATTAEKTYTLPDSSVTLLYAGGPLGTPSSATLTNATGLPVGGISATGTPSSTTYLRGDGAWATVSATTANNLAGGTLGSVPYQLLSGSTTFLAGNTTTTPQFLTSTGVAGVATAPTYTGSTGSGNVVLATSPTLVTPALGTPSSGTLTNCTFPTLNQNTTGTASNVTGTVAIANGGTGQTTANAAYNALSPMTTTGDIEYRNGSSVATRLGIGSTGQVLTVSGGLPAWSAVTLPTGTVKQVVQTTKTDSFTTTSTSYVTFMTVSITPSSSSSKILITFGTNGGTGGDVGHGYLAIFRDSTQLFKGDAAGSRRGATSVINTATQQQLYYGGTFLDSPATTSAISYTIQVLSSNGTTIALNRSARDTDLLAYDGRSVSSITVTEILG